MFYAAQFCAPASLYCEWRVIRTSVLPPELRQREENNQAHQQEYEQRQQQWEEHRRVEEERQARIEEELAVKYRQQEDELRRRQEENRQFMQVIIQTRDTLLYSVTVTITRQFMQVISPGHDHHLNTPPSLSITMLKFVPFSR